MSMKALDRPDAASLDHAIYQFGRRGRQSFYRDLVTHFGSEARFDYNAFPSAEHGFIYISNPKVACSSTKASLNKFVAGRAGREYAIESMADIHDRARSPIPKPGEMGADACDRLVRDRKVIRFTFTRDPMARLVSAYLSKIAPCAPVTAIGGRWRERVGRHPDSHISLEEFAEMCASDTDLRDLDPHGRLQRDQVCFDLLPFDAIGDQSEFPAHFATITRRIFGEVVPLVDTRRMYGHFTDAARKEAELSPRLRRRVMDAYAADYEMLEEIRARGLRPE